LTAQQTLKKPETGQTEPDLLALYDVRPGNGAGLFHCTGRAVEFGWRNN